MVAKVYTEEYLKSQYETLYNNLQNVLARFSDDNYSIKQISDDKLIFDYLEFKDTMSEDLKHLVLSEVPQELRNSIGEKIGYL